MFYSKKVGGISMLLIHTQCGGKVDISNRNKGKCAKCGQEVSVRLSGK